MHRRPGQRVADDRFHPALAEGAARLLVGEDILEPDDFLGEPGKTRLRRIDHRQPLVELEEVLVGRPARLFEPLADARADRIEPLRHEPRQVRLPRRERFRHRTQRAFQFGIGQAEFRQTPLEAFLPPCRLATGAPRGEAEGDQRGANEEHGRG